VLPLLQHRPSSSSSLHPAIITRARLHIHQHRGRDTTHPPLLSLARSLSCNRITAWNLDTDHVQSHSTNLVIILVMMQAAKKIPFEDPNVLMGVRGLYILSNVIIFGVYMYTKMQIDKKRGMCVFLSFLFLSIFRFLVA
jgi:hypothetical protein